MLLASQVAAMWVEENGVGMHVNRHIIVFSHSGVVIDAKTTKIYFASISEITK